MSEIELFQKLNFLSQKQTMKNPDEKVDLYFCYHYAERWERGGRGRVLFLNTSPGLVGWAMLMISHTTSFVLFPDSSSKEEEKKKLIQEPLGHFHRFPINSN